MAMATLRVHYEPINSTYPKECECVVEFLLFLCKRRCTVHLGIWFENRGKMCVFGIFGL